MRRGLEKSVNRVARIAVLALSYGRRVSVRTGNRGSAYYADQSSNCQAVMRIKIIDVPLGEAPEGVRRAWIGMVVPLAQRSANPVQKRGFGVLTGPKSMLVAFLRWLIGGGSRERGYTVDAKTAFDLLASHDRVAFEWWQENAPHLFHKGQRLLFHDHACEVLDEKAG